MNTEHHNMLRRTLRLKPDHNGVQQPIPSDMVAAVEKAEDNMTAACARSGYSRGEMLCIVSGVQSARRAVAALRAELIEAGVLKPAAAKAESTVSEESDSVEVQPETEAQNKPAKRGRPSLKDRVRATGAYDDAQIEKASKEELKEMLEAVPSAK